MSESPESTSNSSSPPPEKAPRNPAERLFVWGVILIGAVVIGIEATARFGYGATLSRITAALEQDGSENHQPLSIQNAEKLIAGFPSKVGEQQGRLNSTVTYRWSGLFKNYGAIQITYDSEDQMVTGVVTEGAPAVTFPIDHAEGGAPDDASQSVVEGTPGSESPGPGGPPGSGGGGGGGRGFDPFQNDADGDGKLSREEAPERMRENFDEIDTNQDGFIDKDELEARRAARSQRPPGE